MVKQALKIFLFIGAVPAGQRKLAGERIHFLDILNIIDQGGGTIGQLFFELGAGPVENRHEIVADDLDPGLAQTTDILAVIGDVLVTGGQAQLDVLMDRDTFNHVEMQAIGFDVLLQGSDAFMAPDLADGDIIDSSDNRVHRRNLADIGKGDRVLGTIPAKRQFQGRIPHFLDYSYLSARDGLQENPLTGQSLSSTGMQDYKYFTKVARTAPAPATSSPK